MPQFKLLQVAVACTMACIALSGQAEIQAQSAAVPNGDKAILNTSVSLDRSQHLVLQLDGEAFESQTVSLYQNGMVFYEQTLKPGRFKIERVVPVSLKAPVLVKLKPMGQAAQEGELPLRAQERRSFYAKSTESVQSANALQSANNALNAPSTKSKDDIEFDSEFLRGKAFRNLDAVQIRNLGQAPAGRLQVEIFRNDLFIQKTDVLFQRLAGSGATRACFTQAHIQQMGVNSRYYTTKAKAFIKESNDVQAKPVQLKTNSDCLFIEDWVPGATAQYEPGELRLNVSIAQGYISRQFKQSVPPELLTQGESAGFINYNLNTFNASYANTKSNSTFLSLNTGLNAGAWQLRQNSYWNQASGNGSHFVTTETVAKRALIDQKASLAVGDTYTFSPIIGSTSFRGARISSEEGLMPDEERRYTPVVRGVARTNARVRIKQNSTVFFEQNVPPGPFEFSDLTPVSTIGDLLVTVTEADGTEQNFTVPYSFTASKLNPGSWRYSVTSGMYRNAGSATGPGLVQAYLRYGLNNTLSPGVEVLASNKYQNIGLQANVYNGLGNLSFNYLFSNLTSPQSQSGSYYNANYQSNALGALSLSAGLGHQSLKYLTADSGLNGGNNITSTVGNLNSFKDNRYVGVGISLQQYGALSLSTSQSSNWNQVVSSQQTRLSYGVTLRQVGLSVNYDRAVSVFTPEGLNTVSLAVNVPLSLAQNNGGLRAAYSKTDHSAATESLSYYGSGGTNNNLNYALSTSQQASSNFSSASVNVLHPWGYLGSSLSASNNASNQLGLSAGGGVVIHRGGVMLSPTLGNTFGILEVPHGEGIEVLGGFGARVNKNGYGVIQNLTPYYLNDIELNLNNASMNVEIDNTIQKVAPVEGSIVRLKFSSNAGKPVLIQLTRIAGEKVPIGASVFDEADQTVGSVGQGSRALLRLTKDKGRLKVIWGDLPAQRCEFDYQLDAKTPANANGFINLKVQCDKNGPAVAVSLATP